MLPVMISVRGLNRQSGPSTFLHQTGPKPRWRVMAKFPLALLHNSTNATTRFFSRPLRHPVTSPPCDACRRAWNAWHRGVSHLDFRQFFRTISLRRIVRTNLQHSSSLSPYRPCATRPFHPFSPSIPHGQWPPTLRWQYLYYTKICM